MAQYFIRHPLQAIVLAVLLTLSGLIAAFRLPIAEYPGIMPPTVSVSATYQGADAAVVQDTVASVIEAEIRGLDGLRAMTSNSDAAGNYKLDIEFAPGIDGYRFGFIGCAALLAADAVMVLAAVRDR